MHYCGVARRGDRLAGTAHAKPDAPAIKLATQEQHMSASTKQVTLPPPDADGHYTMEEAKKFKVPGMKFKAPTGSIGTVLEETSSRGKLQASLTCTAGGPDHIREVSDWHQCGVSPEMKKKSKKKSGGSTTIAAGNVTTNAEEVRRQLEEKLAAAKAQVAAQTPTEDAALETGAVEFTVETTEAQG